MFPMTGQMTGGKKPVEFLAENSSQQKFGTRQTSSSFSINFGNEAGNNRVLIFAGGVVTDQFVGVPSSVTYGGVSVNLEASGDSIELGGLGLNGSATWLGWLNESDLPSTSGNKTLAITMTSATGILFGVAVYLFENVDQSSPLTDFQTDTGGGGTSMDITFSNGVGQLGVSSYGTRNTSTTHGTPSSGWVEAQDHYNGGYGVGSAYSAELTSDTHTYNGFSSGALSLCMSGALLQEY